MLPASVERFTQAFYDWEVRGRGWLTYPYAVSLEPVFRPFAGHGYSPGQRIDDARRHTWISQIIEQYFGSGTPSTTEDTEEESGEDVPEEALPQGPLAEYLLGLPVRGQASRAAAEGWLRSLVTCHDPLSFELAGSGGDVSMHLAASGADAAHVTGQLRAFFPEAVIVETPETLRSRWQGMGSPIHGCLEFGLANEFMAPLRTPERFSPDPLTSLLGTLGEIAQDELAIVQVLFQQVAAPWADSMLRATVNSRGEPFFLDAPELTTLARQKVATPLYAVVLRLAACGNDEESVWRILRSLAGGLAQFGSPERNELAPLAAEDLAIVVDDLLSRSTHRSGMILSLDELLSFVHLPTLDVGIPSLWSGSERTKAPPAEARGRGTYLGTNTHQGTRVSVSLSADHRSRHTYVIGASGTGKSTLLARLIVEDIEAGRGVGVLDPHGDLIDELLTRIPERRRDEVMLLDPADQRLAVGWNMLAAHSEVEREILASDLVAVFRRLSTSWGDQMTAVLSNAILAFLESSRGGTLLDLRQFLIDKSFRTQFLETVADEHLQSWWTTEFALLVGRKPQAPILTRLNTFLGSKLIRRIVTERKSQIDFRDFLERGGIFLGKLAQGAIGTENAALLGTLIVSKFHQVAIARAELAPEERHPFYLHLDEFHEVATPSMATLFSGARKYQLGLTVAHQDLYQLHAKVPDVERAVLANAFTRICFRVDDEDARKLERGFGYFTADDLGNLDTGEAIVRLGRKQDDFNLSTELLPRIDPHEATDRREAILQLLQEKYGREPERAEVPPKVSPPPPPREAPRPEPAPAPREPPPPAAPAQPGRGGPEHKYLQSLIREWGQAKGYRCEVEKEISGGHVDVTLTRDDHTLACEISVSTPAEHELGNVEKCLAESFDQVVVVSLKKRFLTRLSRLLDERLPAAERARVSVVAPEEFPTQLRDTPDREQRVAGYKVRTRYTGADAGDQQQRRQNLAKVISRSLQRLRKDQRS